MKELRKNFDKVAVYGALALGVVALSGPGLAGGRGKNGEKNKPQASSYGAPGFHDGHTAQAPTRALGIYESHHTTPVASLTKVGMGYGHGRKDYGAAKTSSRPDIVDTAKAAGSFNTLLSALNAAELTSVLEGEGPFTVFAPTDAAFAKLPEGTLEALLADKDKLVAVLKYHVVAGKVTSSDVAAAQELDTVEGTKLPTSTISVAKADIMARNGIIHVVDQVLVPPTL
jgi:uncharacterized surface protein with fasciclin (FAS1) repeats